jgi:hypothetical protein
MTTRLALAFALLAVAATGCGAGDGNAVDAGPGIDADPGSADAGAPDAVPVDAEPTAPDAAPDATPVPTAARVTVLTLARDGLPQIGAAVVFADPDGGPVTRRVTGADGTASADIARGASVTVVWATTTGARLLTITDLEPGDDLVVGEPARAPAPPSNRDVVLSFFPHEMLPAKVYSRCNDLGVAVPGTATSATVRISGRCDAAGVNDDFVLVTTVGNTNYVSTLLDVPQAESHDMPGFGGADDMMMTLVNLPDDLAKVSAWRRLRRGGHPFLAKSALTLDAPVGALTLPIDLGGLVAGDDMLMNTSFTRASSPRHTQHVRDVQAPSSSYGFDAAEVLLPWFQPGVFDPAARRLEWSLSDGRPFDMLVIGARYTRGSGSSERSFDWLVVTASSTGSYVLPALPTDLVGDILPAAGDVAWIAEGDLFEATDRTYRDLVQRFDVDQPSWFVDEGPGIGPRTVYSHVACGGRACPGM